MITVKELDSIMPLIFTSKQLESIKWVDIPSLDKEVLLTQAVAYMGTLRFRGRYKEDGQEQPFPRKIQNKETGGWYVVEVNDNIRKALACIVFDILKNQSSSRYEYRKQGVKSISTGSVSESYTEEVKEVSDNYKKYIGKYLFRGVL